MRTEAFPSIFADSSEIVKWLVRFAYLVKGILYLAVGWFAMQAAVVGFRGTKGTEEFFRLLMSEEFYGKPLLLIIAGGLICYCLWKLIEILKLPKRPISLPKKVFTVTANISLGIVYATLSITALELVLGTDGPDDYTQEQFISDILHWHFGKWLIIAAGAGVMVFAGLQFYYMVTCKFRKKFNKIEMNRHERRGMIVTGILGHGARGLVHGIIGSFLVRAALTFEPEQAGGVQEALDTLANQVYGPYILGGTAIGLICYGLFSLLLAWYKRIYL